MPGVHTLLPEAAHGLAAALVASAPSPMLLLDETLTVLAVSRSFTTAFRLREEDAVGRLVRDIGAGEWAVPQLSALLQATVNGHAAVDAYEFDLAVAGALPRCLIVTAQKLDYFDAAHVRIMLSIHDATDERLAAKHKDDLVREKQILLQELQHRVANSLQIIASVLMQSARRVQQDEARLHLNDAHNRVMSIATLQRMLATSRLGAVPLRSYFTDLCRSIAASMIPDPQVLTLVATVDETEVDADVSVSLGLVMTELVINALKHGYPAGRGGRISVQYHAHGPGWILVVADDGIGMPHENADAKPGLGTGIVDALSKQLKATVAITDAQPGTIVTITATG